jgi:hypothetical protein
MNKFNSIWIRSSLLEEILCLRATRESRFIVIPVPNSYFQINWMRWCVHVLPSISADCWVGFPLGEYLKVIATLKLTDKRGFSLFDAKSIRIHQIFTIPWIILIISASNRFFMIQRDFVWIISPDLTVRNQRITFGMKFAKNARINPIQIVLDNASNSHIG